MYNTKRIKARITWECPDHRHKTIDDINEMFLLIIFYSKYWFVLIESPKKERKRKITKRESTFNANCSPVSFI